MKPTLNIIVPCHNAEKELLMVAPVLLDKIEELSVASKISNESRIFFIDDASEDNTYKTIISLSNDYPQIMGMTLSRYCGFDNSLMAGFEESQNCDIVIVSKCSINIDFNAIDRMIDEYLFGADIVFALTKHLKAPIISANKNRRSNFMLLSSKVINELNCYNECNLSVSEVVSDLGLPKSAVYFSEKESNNKAVKNLFMIKKYTESSSWFSDKLLEFVFPLAGLLFLLSFVTMIFLSSNKNFLWIAFSFLLTSIVLINIGVLAKSLKNILSEIKQRPRYSVRERTFITKK